MLMVLMVSLAVGGVGILGVDFAANASSKAIKESVDLSAAPDDANPTYSVSINSANQYEYTFNYNGTTTGTDTAKIGSDGSMQQITLRPGSYVLEAWGGEGGAGMNATTAGVAGKGGYVKVEYTITANTTLYVAVGGKGPTSTINGTMCPGGWNGGGPSGVNGAGYRKGGGGGATHIAFAKYGDGQLSNYATHKTDLLLVAGGGGGTGGYSTVIYTNNSNTTATTAKGGAGGGSTGGSSTGWYSGYGPSTGGSQTAGGQYNTKTYYTRGQGRFGQGGSGVLDAAEYNVAVGGNAAWGPAAAGGGGGGGYFGGAGGGDFGLGGGGGSSYIDTGKATTVSNTQGNRSGHGMVKITEAVKIATQTSVPTLTLNRHDEKTYAFKGTDAATSLLGTDPAGYAVSMHTNAVYQINDNIPDTVGTYTTQNTLLARTFTDAEKANATANKWLSYSFTSTGVTLKATRYWPGTKAFYVRVKNEKGAPSWFKFYASVEGGELKKDKTPKMKNYE